METQTLIMLAGLAFNFIAMMVGGVSVLLVVLRHNLRQENRMATMEAQILQLMRAAGLKVRQRDAFEE